MAWSRSPSDCLSSYLHSTSRRSGTYDATHTFRRIQSSVIRFPEWTHRLSSQPMSVQLSSSYAPHRLVLPARLEQTTLAHRTETGILDLPKMDALLNSLLSPSKRTPGGRHPEESNAASSEWSHQLCRAMDRPSLKTRYYYGAAWGYKRCAPGE
ncbi:uncharacterized protein C8Q71DRAFT_285278 [Rhodofomes roseus]|uniref:Uncharacterized protein n=1 Tax=Rhodofomes roseus TaxID=34475 RepID=A0ABQ8K572_9APHY|nr:uncharacterized protein C8Q71DRAFT_285278 [Rhodofomes roseus]KAH9831793.1 hypothetical protein C8Q71DRAFT_285278 [Rhodofomes roseus]